MACSRFEYVRKFEQHATLLPGTWIVLRLDGRGFTRFTTVHKYAKPNDVRGLGLMNAAARTVLSEFKDVVLAFGSSDEYSFVLKRTANTFNRRAEKLLSTITSLFAADFVRQWQYYFPSTLLQYTPSFDARIVLYPTTKHLRDYLSWRQADVHVNNLYNTVFCAQVRAGRTPREAEQDLCGTSSGEKQELLFSSHSINYNDEDPMFRKGSVVIRVPRGVPCPDVDSAFQESSLRPPEATPRTSNCSGTVQESSNDECYGNSNEDERCLAGTAANGAVQTNAGSKNRQRERIVVLHVDIIKDKFWQEHSFLLDGTD